MDKDTELIPPWDEEYGIPYRGERDYEMVIQLLRGNIVTLSTTLQVSVIFCNSCGLAAPGQEVVVYTVGESVAYCVS